jgi:hypothetical protein
MNFLNIPTTGRSRTTKVDHFSHAKHKEAHHCYWPSAFDSACLPRLASRVFRSSDFQPSCPFRADQ